MFRYKKLGYVALNVSDLARSVPFYRDLVGLQLNEQVDGGPAFFACSADHHNVVLYEGGEPGLKRVGWEMEQPEELDRLFEHLAAAGLKPAWLPPDECRALRQQRTLRIRSSSTRASSSAAAATCPP
jgi:2,3-dihydroxy-p-cumate/2,3-dihydroxybenzoate 3,4-dioxygenase